MNIAGSIVEEIPTKKACLCSMEVVQRNVHGQVICMCFRIWEKCWLVDLQKLYSTLIKENSREVEPGGVKLTAEASRWDY